MRGKNLIWLTFIALLLVSPMVVNVSFAAPDPVISIVDVNGDPPDFDNMIQTNPTEYFLIAIDVADAVDVAGFEVKITWDKALTEFPPEPLEGWFLQNSGIPVANTFAANFLFGYIIVGGFLKMPGGVSGSGTLAYVMFQVKATQSGSSPIHLAESKLFNQFGVEYDHTAVDGMFFTTKPFVGFSWTPSQPIPGTVITFDGSASYDPDNTISDPTPGPLADFAWDFGDGSAVVHGLTVTHTYAAYKRDPYKVKLTVTDDDGETWFLVKDLRVWRDLGIVTVWPSMDEWDSTNYDGYQTQADPYDMYGEGWILVAVNNFGSVTETFDVAVSVDGYDYNGVFYHFDAYPYVRTNCVLTPGAGSGFSYWFVLDISYGAQVWGTNDPVPPGQYTITATVTNAFDQDLSNNVMTAPFGVHGSVEVTNIVRASAGQAAHVYKLKHGPITFGGFFENFDNTFGVMRDPQTDQGEWGRIAVDIYDEAGDPVAHVTSDAVYLNYLERTVDQMTATWMDAAVGKYSAVAYAEFGIDGANFPYWGENTFAFDFAVV